MHYRQYQLGIIDEAGKELRSRRGQYNSATCVAKGCTTDPVARGMCSKHYQQWQEGIIDEVGRVLRPVQEKESQVGRHCKIEGCTETARSRGFCPRHYSNFYKGIYDIDGNKLREPTRVGTWAGQKCKIENCDHAAQSLGLCHLHYRQFRSGLIDEAGVQLRESMKGRHPHRGYRTVQRGYIKLKVDNHPHADRDGYVMEHRLVMEEHLGRYLEPGEVVHHLDGVRDHNVISNLQLLEGRKKHHPFHAPITDVEGALTLLEGLVHESMEGGSDTKIRLQHIVRRLKEQ
jgi:hypothetical protein